MKIIIAMLAASGFLLFGCNQKSGQGKEPASVPPQVSARPKPVFPAPDSFRVGLGKVYEGYANIESALAHDDFAGAKDAFQAMHAVLHILQTDGLDSAGTAHWDSLDASMMEVLHPMAASENIAGMRDHLIDFSPLVLDAIEKFGASTQTQAYLFHCPMARENQGADWLQRDTILLNPYYGKSMSTCGTLIRQVVLP